jgi:hypothetical protein
MIGRFLRTPPHRSDGGSRVTNRVPGIALLLLPIFRLHNGFLLCNGFSMILLLWTLFSVIVLVFNIIAVLDFVDRFAQNRRWCLAKFVTREDGKRSPTYWHRLTPTRRRKLWVES